MKDIETLRKTIDSIDREILSLFEARMNVIEEVAAYKKEIEQPIRDIQRETEVIKEKIDLLHKKIYGPYVKKLFQEIMAMSLDYQKQLILKK